MELQESCPALYAINRMIDACKRLSQMSIGQWQDK